ncbi:MAG: ATP-binding protein [Coriobacteriia bacterium]|nr:ATP-binding protein [Coriobacteriia bacterium]
MNNDSTLVARVTEIRGTKIRAKVFSDKNEAFIFQGGRLIRNVSVGGYVKIPCGFNQVIGRIDGEVQEEKLNREPDYSKRSTQGSSFNRFIDISVFGVKVGNRFDRGVTILPLVSSDVYVLTPEELALISSHMEPGQDSFRLGNLAGQDGISVIVPTSSLFASHIGIFGNTGSGKSNTLCRIYSDCLDKMKQSGALGTGKSQFIVIDFNGEYIAPTVLTDAKKVYNLSTDTKQGGDKISVPDDFYFDLETWSILTQATEKTQRPFLRSCINTAKRIKGADDPEAYLAKMISGFIGDYCGKAPLFNEQREEFSRTMAYLIDKNDLESAEDTVLESVEDIEVFSYCDPPTLRIVDTNIYGNTPEMLVSSVFEKFMELEKDYISLISDIPGLIEFVAKFLFLQRWRKGSIIRDHISFWIPRLDNQLREARKIYVTSGPSGMFDDGYAVRVYSLLDVNQEQKKLIPLIIAKYIYREQKQRGRLDTTTSVHFIIDEAHNILSYSSQRESEGWRDYRLETFEEIVKEGRKFGMYLTVSSQRPSDISATIISQMHNYLIHRLVNDEDLSAIAKAVSFIDHSTNSMIPVLPQGTCVASGTAVPYPTQVRVDQLPEERRPRSADRDLASAWALEKT